MRNQGIGSWPARRVRSSPDQVALIHDDRPLTYADLHRRVLALAASLRERGVEPGDRVGYLGPNHPAFVETMFATHALGAVFVPLNFRLAAPEIDYMLADSGVGVLVYAPHNSDVVAGLVDHTGPRVALADPADGEDAYAALAEPAVDDSRSEPLDVPVAHEDPALILYTSGTTGRPKGAVLTHGNLVWNCVNMMVDVDLAADEIVLVAAPLFHVAALNQTLLPTFLKGGTSVIMPSWDVDGCLDLVARHRVTWMFGVTAMFAGLTQSPRWDEADLSSLRKLMSGGAPIPAALIERYQQRGLVFCQGYGLTETSPGATFLGERDSVRKIGSAGAPCFFVDVRVVGPDLSPVAPGTPGEVLIQGPNVTPGYWDNPDATERAFADGDWFRSGDLATIDEDGFLTIVDRVKDMYISGGENVYPAEVEGVLFAHPGVGSCAVVGVPDERWGEVGVAFVVPSGSAKVDPEEVREFLRERLARYKVPATVEVVDELPRTGSGKVRKNELRRRAG